MDKKDETATELASAHRREDPQTTIVKYFPGGDSIRLLEVSSSAPTTGEILPFAFTADVANGILFPSTVILVSPAEWSEIEAGRLPLPEDWELTAARDI